MVAPIPSTHQAEASQVAALSEAAVLATLHTTSEGLSPEEVTKRLVRYGANKLTAKKKISPWQLYLEQFKNTFTVILIGAAFLILFIYQFGERDSSDLIEAGLILSIVVMITVLGFLQEFKAEKAIVSLQKLLAYKARVRRAGREAEISVTELVPGDIVRLEEGEKVPADIRLLSVTNLRVNEAVLTGEAVAVGKQSGPLTNVGEISGQKNMVFSGTSISTGRAIGVVVTTGDRTEIGTIAQHVAETVDEETPLQKRLDTIGKRIGMLILGICVSVFIYIVFFAQEFVKLPLIDRVVHSFIASVALAVAAIPEGLPAVVTISLAFGTQRMLKRHALVRKLSSIETLGSTDVICSDKTGTLTKGEMTVTEIVRATNHYTVSGTGYETTGSIMLVGKPADLSELTQLFTAGVLCNNARLQSDGTILGDPTEAALLVSARKANVSPAGERAGEIPFSSERKMMSVIINTDSAYVVYTKGAPEVVLARCTKTQTGSTSTDLTASERTQILKAVAELSANALRTLGFAYKPITLAEYEAHKTDEAYLESNLTFLGIQGMMDPPREEVKRLIAGCQQAGVRVAMITGDHEETAKAVAAQIGITGEVLTGAALETLTDEAFGEKVEQVSIYARVNPSAKMRIVGALQQKGHIVAMTGDGVNDAPALKKADIGIAMGVTGTDVAKEASDMVLLDDHFGTIVSAIEEGRGIFHNIRKFVVYLLASNIAEVLIVFLGVLFFQKLPLSATMLLWINIVTDGIPAIALGIDPAERTIMQYKPRVFQADIIDKKLWMEMIIFGCLLAMAVLALFAITLPEGFAHAQAVAFTATVLGELVGLYLIRSGYNIAFTSNIWLLLSVIISFLLQIILLSVPLFALIFGVTNLTVLDWTYMFIACLILSVLHLKVRDMFEHHARGKVQVS